MKRYTAAVFDLDGTLLDTLGDLTAAVNTALQAENMPLRTITEVRGFVGNGIANLIERSVADGTDEAVTARCLARFKEYYAEHIADLTAPYDGVTDLLAGLRAAGIKSCVVSNKFDEGVAELCKRFFGELIDFSVGESPTVRRKPAPDSVLRAVELLGVAPDNVLYIGDSEVDGQTAHNAGLDFVGVSWGFRSREVIMSSGALAVVDAPDDLKEYFGIK